MKQDLPMRHVARVQMHFSSGVTRVVLSDVANDSTYWDIPTERIPPRLRAVGTMIVVEIPLVRPEASDTGEDIRRALSHIVVEEFR
jgi:hypothetical protein